MGLPILQYLEVEESPAMSTPPQTRDAVVEADDRGRVSLGRAGAKLNHRYVAHMEPDGTVILTPAAVVTSDEARFLQNTGLVEQIEDNRAHPERLKKMDRKARRRG
jgi:hypothetical protein